MAFCFSLKRSRTLCQQASEVPTWLILGVLAEQVLGGVLALAASGGLVTLRLNSEGLMDLILWMCSRAKSASALRLLPHLGR